MNKYYLTKKLKKKIYTLIQRLQPNQHLIKFPVFNALRRRFPLWVDRAEIWILLPIHRLGFSYANNAISLLGLYLNQSLAIFSNLYTIRSVLIDYEYDHGDDEQVYSLKIGDSTAPPLKIVVCYLQAAILPQSEDHPNRKEEGQGRKNIFAFEVQLI